MTTIVGVLNKRAVAIAADSAVTLGNTHKVMNTGNKIFSLSKYAPVGIAIYGNASLMVTPWEVIIKSYRRKLGNKKFQYLKGYLDDFLNYLRKHEFFASSELQHKQLCLQMKLFLGICIKNAKARPNYSLNSTQALVDELNECKNTNQSTKNVIPDFAHYSYSDFKEYAKNEIEEVLNNAKELDATLHYDIFAESYYHYMIVPGIDRNGQSGLVFIGYGEEEIYPCLYNVMTAIGFGQKLQFWFGEDAVITNDDTTAAIIPFAQVEATQTIIRGINPTFHQIIAQNVKNTLAQFVNTICTLLRTDGLDTYANKISRLDVSALTQAFTISTQSAFNNNYTLPLVNTIEHLGLSDMANVAESLVALTSLINRMSPKEESVGGPVDVAVISKGDGLIWIKRKHYFNPDFNAQFFNNYNND